MRRTILQNPLRPRDNQRRGTATVEFAVTAPIFMAILLGIAEMSRGLDASQRLSAAVREGGREAASDISDSIPKGWTLNQKVTKDIQNMLTAGGIDGTKVTVTITYADGATAGQAFDLQLPANDLKYFKITATVPYGNVGIFPMRALKGKNLSASVVFRLGRSSLSS
ncbi:TadE/TadG family type IV pilus assembly protein [Planctomicrobium piriforme]|uniref:TadE-like protein n=1 Tax=Planctomicrobium piriforme TaxID=1576369 RepID=A0A1I3QDR8_9PLAN|nr:TadE/TadG family type IV pilus assembly protein [Planctomicrobium piriforme]SFJ31256.1 TadE-like protein [Planctomicrobium piriforme]